MCVESAELEPAIHLSAASAKDEANLPARRRAQCGGGRGLGYGG